MEGVMEMWACKRYSNKYPGVCVEPGKIKVIPLSNCEKALNRELNKQRSISRRNIKKLETEIDKLNNK